MIDKIVTNLDHLEMFLAIAEPTASGREKAAGLVKDLRRLLGETKMAFAWVIEHAESPPGQPTYFTGKLTPALRWSTDQLEACRFARREDAERLAVSLDGARLHRLAEHGWHEELRGHVRIEECGAYNANAAVAGTFRCRRPMGHEGPHHHNPPEAQ